MVGWDTSPSSAVKPSEIPQILSENICASAKSRQLMNAVMKKRGAEASRHWSDLRQIHAVALARWLAAHTLAHNSAAGLDPLHSSNAVSLHCKLNWGRSVMQCTGASFYTNSQTLSYLYPIHHLYNPSTRSLKARLETWLFPATKPLWNDVDRETISSITMKCSSWLSLNGKIITSWLSK